MKNFHRQFNKCVYRILKSIEQGTFKPEESDLFYQCLKFCIDQNYISGIEYLINAAGDPIFQRVKPRIEHSGLELLHPKKNYIQIITCVCSIITAIATAGALLFTILNS